MALSEDKIKEYIKRLLLSCMRILCNHGFYGLLLMHMTYSVSESIETACTDGVRIVFGTDYLDSLSDSELDFVNIEVDNRYLDSYDLFFDDNIELIPIDGKAPSLDEEKCLYPSDVFSFDTSAFKSFSFDIDSSD